MAGPRFICSLAAGGWAWALGIAALVISSVPRPCFAQAFVLTVRQYGALVASENDLSAGLLGEPDTECAEYVRLVANGPDWCVAEFRHQNNVWSGRAIYYVDGAYMICDGASRTICVFNSVTLGLDFAELFATELLGRSGVAGPSVVAELGSEWRILPGGPMPPGPGYEVSLQEIGASVARHLLAPRVAMGWRVIDYRARAIEGTRDAYQYAVTPSYQELIDAAKLIPSARVENRYALPWGALIGMLLFYTMALGRRSGSAEKTSCNM